MIIPDISHLLPKPIKENLSDDEWTLRVAMSIAKAERLDWKDVSERGKERFLDIAKDEPDQTVRYIEKKWEKIRWANHYDELFPKQYGHYKQPRRQTARKTAR
jgi:hypothetical protein